MAVADIEISFLIVPSFSSKNVDEKFTLIMECKYSDIACVCITNICIMYKARDTLTLENTC